MVVTENQFIDEEGIVIFLDVLGIKDIQNRKEVLEMLVFAGLLFAGLIYLIQV